MRWLWKRRLLIFFSGFHITVARQIKIGDYIKLDSGEEGYVIDINWRTTKIKMLPNNVALIPNEKLTKAIVTNYYLPDKEMAVLVNLGVHYDSDLKKVEKITCETAREIMKTVPGGVPGFEPFIRYNTFGDSSIGFTVILRAKEFADQYLIKHEFIKRLHERYKKENIIIVTAEKPFLQFLTVGLKSYCVFGYIVLLFLHFYLCSLKIS